MKKILSTVCLLTFISCSNADNPETKERAFIAYNAILSYLAIHENDEAVDGEGCNAKIIDDSVINGYLPTNCIYIPTEDFLTLQQACDKNTYQEISGTVDIHTENTVLGGLVFKGLFVADCTYNLVFDEQDHITGTVCGVNITEFSGLSVSQPSDAICAELN